MSFAAPAPSNPLNESLLSEATAARRRLPPGTPVDHLERVILMLAGAYNIMVVACALAGFKSEEAQDRARDFASMPFGYLLITLTFVLKASSWLSLHKAISIIAVLATAASIALQIAKLDNKLISGAIAAFLLAISNAAEAYIYYPFSIDKESGKRKTRYQYVQRFCDLLAAIISLVQAFYFAVAAAEDPPNEDKPIPWQEVTVFPNAVLLYAIHALFESVINPSLPRQKKYFMQFNFLVALLQYALAIVKLTDAQVTDLYLIIAQNISLTLMVGIMLANMLHYMLKDYQAVAAVKENTVDAVQDLNLPPQQAEPVKREVVSAVDAAATEAQGVREGRKDPSDRPAVGSGAIDESAIAAGALAHLAERGEAGIPSPVIEQLAQTAAGTAGPQRSELMPFRATPSTPTSGEGAVP